jgi:uncharacterized OB-fold protein
MSPAGRPYPGDVAPDALDQPFWDACRQHRLLVHRCGECGRSYWPASCCVTHGSAHMAWVEASGRARLHTYTVFEHVYGRTFFDGPYNVSVVELAEGPLFHTNVIDCPPDELVVGMELEVVFEDADEGFTLPVFRRQLLA